MPRLNEMILDEIALSLLPCVSLRMAVHLLDVFGDARGVYAASRDELAGKAMLRRDIAEQILSKASHGQSEKELDHCRRSGLTPVGISSEYYPPLLRQCCDYPVVLYVVGDPAALTARMLGIVGTRKITPYGAQVCGDIVGGIASEGPALTITSGLAYGVDSAAHRAALASGLKTVAVLGNKLPRIYPAENAPLARRIVESGGALLSEMHSGAYEGPSNFVARNRIIAGMCMGTLIVESPRKGGSMITADLASGYDRVVMAVPGRVTDESSAGPNRLIRSMKAVAVCSGSDVVRELGLGDGTAKKNRVQAARPAARPPAKTGDPVYDLIAASDGGITVDRISDVTGLPASEIMASLFSLELEGMVRKFPGGIYTKM